VPEAPVDEHRDAAPGEQQIGPTAGEPGQSMVDPEPHPTSVRLLSQGEFRRGVAVRLPGHPGGHGGAGR
jgi:hypothetical protein